MYNGIGVVISTSCYGQYSSNPANIISDSFNRSDSLTLGTADTGQAWTTTTFGISNNQAYRSSSTAPIATIALGQSGGFVQFRESVLTESATFQGILFRYSDVNNYWRLVLQDNSFFLQKREAGVNTTIGVLAITRFAGQIFKVTFSGSTIVVYVNGFPVLTATNAFNSTATIVGLIASNTTTGRMDDFQAGV